MPSPVLGIDLGTSGVRAAVLDPAGRLVHNTSTGYNSRPSNPESWLQAVRTLIRAIPDRIRNQLGAVAVDGTSGTLLACNSVGRPLGDALLYDVAFPEFAANLKELIPEGGSASSSSSSLARAMHLIQRHGPNCLLRHQADWISGWLLSDWRWGEEGNNLRMGWDLDLDRWHPAVEALHWFDALPTIRASGALLGLITAERADQLGLPINMKVIAGTTDSNASVLAANPEPGDGITVLGTTLVMKRFTDVPINATGITRHRVGGRWLCGGASNAGAGVLRRFFPDEELKELSRQINPDTSSGLVLRPLNSIGERFPVDDPNLQPVLEPRPVSDALYLHGLLEGLTEIEALGWERLRELGAPPHSRVISLGGGARNPQWRRMRERRLGCPVLSCNVPPAAGVAQLARQGLMEHQLSH